MSKNAEGWIRHRGGKCPVEDGVKVDYRMRSGDVDSFGRKSDTLYWDHDNEGGDIMAYRLHKPAEQVAPFFEAVQAFNALAKTPQLDGPLQWRDRIVTIGFEIHSLTAERAELVQRLAGEGFTLTGRVIDPVEDMSDWRNWKVGDLITFSCDRKDSCFTYGKQYVFRGIDKYGACGVVKDDTGEENGWRFDLFKFHSRPSA